MLRSPKLLSQVAMKHLINSSFHILQYSSGFHFRIDHYSDRLVGVVVDVDGCFKMIRSVRIWSTSTHDRPVRNPACCRRKVASIFSWIRYRITLQMTLKTMHSNIIPHELLNTVRSLVLSTFTKTPCFQPTGNVAVSHM